MKKYIAEFIGTLVLVLISTGVAAFTGNFVTMFITVPLAFGFSIVAMAYVIGDISGCHLNPAISLAMLINGKIKIVDFIFYVIAQILGALAGSALLYVLLQNVDTASMTYPVITSLGVNAYGETSMTQITLFGALLVECLLTFIFAYAVLGVTSKKENSSVAPLVIGATLTFVHLIGIPLTGTSVNPARSLAPALMTWFTGAGLEPLKQVWVFIVAPLAGAAIAALVFILLNKEKKAKK